MKLLCHRGSPPSPATAIEVLANRLADSRLSLVFAVRGDVGAIRLPVSPEPARKDGLWKHSCFEAFIRTPSSSGYVELNFSPSGDWAAYLFDDYRSGRRPADVDVPIIECKASAGQIGVVAGIDLSPLTDLGRSSDWRLGLSAVIEADDGSLSHWALAHPLGAPDFHHPNCFVLELPPADEA